MSTAAADAPKLKVFISYSRDDLDFADQLVSAIGASGFEPLIDRHGISGGEEWMKRLGNLIREADTVAFVLSPTALDSEMCAWEVSETQRLSKRLIPVVCRPLGSAPVPERLRDLNYIFFYPEPKAPGSGFGKGLADLTSALNTDLDWVREHTRLGQRAAEWDGGGRVEQRGSCASRHLAAQQLADVVRPLAKGTHHVVQGDDAVDPSTDVDDRQSPNLAIRHDRRSLIEVGAD